MTYDEIEGRLNETLTIGRHVQLLRRQIRELEGFRRQFGEGFNREKMAALWAAYAREVTRLLYAKYETAQMLARVKKTDHRLVLEARYVLCLKWDDVADVTHYSLVHVYRLAKAGIAALAEESGAA